jgi:hypothetical protein
MEGSRSELFAYREVQFADKKINEKSTILIGSGFNFFFVFAAPIPMGRLVWETFVRRRNGLRTNWFKKETISGHCIIVS